MTSWSSRPVTGWRVNTTAAASAGTSAWTTTAIAAPSNGSDRRRRYATAAGLQSELQQRRTAGSTSLGREPELRVVQPGDTTRPCRPRRSPMSGRRATSRPRRSIGRARPAAHRRSCGGAGVSRTRSMTVARAASSGSAASASPSGAASRDRGDVRPERRRRQAEPGRDEEPEAGEAVQRRGLAPDGSRRAAMLAQPFDRAGGRGDGRVHARISRSRGLGPEESGQCSNRPGRTKKPPARCGPAACAMRGRLRGGAAVDALDELDDRHERRDERGDGGDEERGGDRR